MENPTTNSFRDLPLEIRLSAYLDGQMDADESREIEALIATDDEARSMVDKLALGSEFGTKAFDDMLKEPVPLHLVRAIKDAAAKAETGKPGLRPANNNFFSFLPRAIAASAILLLAGGYSGYYVGMQNAGKMPTSISETSGLQVSNEGQDGATKTRSFEMPAPAAVGESNGLTLDDVVAGYLTVFGSQTSHMVEIPADQPDMIRTWLKEITAVDVGIPDLSSDGYTLQGARLLAVNSQPMGALFYRDTKGQTIMVGYFKPDPDPAKSFDMSTLDFAAPAKILDGISVGYSMRKGTGIYFVAPEAVSSTDKLRDRVKSAL